jgi:hypothetical protein
VFGSLRPYLAPIPTGPRGNPLLSEAAALEQLLIRDDEIWEHWVVENCGSMGDRLWERVQESAAARERER